MKKFEPNNLIKLHVIILIGLYISYNVVKLLYDSIKDNYFSSFKGIVSKQVNNIKLNESVSF